MTRKTRIKADFLWISGIQDFWISGFLEFWISGILDFHIGFLAKQTNKLPAQNGDSRCKGTKKSAGHWTMRDDAGRCLTIKCKKLPENLELSEKHPHVQKSSGRSSTSVRTSSSALRSILQLGR